MRVRILYHDHCFDGAASSAFFSRFAEAKFYPGATFEYTGGFLGGTVNYFRPTLDYRFFHPMNKGRNILAIRLLTSFVNGFGGKHDFKGGYLRGRIVNDVQRGNSGTGTVTLFYGQDYAQAGTGVSLPCVLGSASCIGVGTLSRSGTKGIGKNLYQGLYFQDRWQPTGRLSLNLGVRFEKEFLPSFNAGDLLAGPRLDRVRCCANPECGWLFLDDSRAGKRRWCSMQSCGNRAKARRHYHRSREQ